MSQRSISGLRRRLLIWACIAYSVIFVLYGLSRVAPGSHRVTQTVAHPFAEGFGYQFVGITDDLTIIRPLEPFNMRDFLTAASLFLTGLACAAFFIILRGIPRAMPEQNLFILFALGFVYLGFDELFQVHEFIGLNLAHRLYPHAQPGELQHLDFNGHIIMFYALVALVLMGWYRRFFLASRTGMALLAAGFTFQAFAAVIDFFWTKTGVFHRVLGPLGFLVFRDEFFEMSAAFLYLCAFVTYGIEHLMRCYRFENGNALLLPMVFLKNNQSPKMHINIQDTHEIPMEHLRDMSIDIKDKENEDVVCKPQ